MVVFRRDPGFLLYLHNPLGNIIQSYGFIYCLYFVDSQMFTPDMCSELHSFISTHLLPWPKPNSQFPPQFVLPKCLTVSASVIPIFLLFRPQILEPSSTPFLSHSPHMILQSLPSLSVLKIFTNIYLPCIRYRSGSCRYRRE